jgi:hypothetical protein
MIGKAIIPLFLFITITSCDLNKYNLKISGRIFDSITQKPIKNAKIYSRSWVYNTRLDESFPLIDSVLTDENGFYSFTLDEAESIDVAVLSKEYIRQVKYMYPAKSIKGLSFNLKLKQ